MKFYAALSILILSGCSSIPTTNYNPEKLDSSELVKLTTLQNREFFTLQYSSFIEKIWNTNGEELTKRNAFFDSPLREFSLPPGTYKFKVRCTRGNLIGYFETIQLLDKNNYRISCDGTRGVSIKFTKTN